MTLQNNKTTSVHYNGKSLSALYTDALHALYALRDEMVNQGLIEGQAQASTPPAPQEPTPEDDETQEVELPF